MPDEPKSPEPAEDPEFTKKWVEEMEAIIDTGTIPQQVELMVRLVDEIVHKLFLLKSVGKKVVMADQQDLLNEQEQENYLAADERLMSMFEATFPGSTKGPTGPGTDDAKDQEGPTDQ